MADVDLGGNTTPIPSDTWDGHMNPQVVTALLEGNNDGAFAAFVEFATQAAEADVLTFPESDLDKLFLGKRKRLARMLVERDLISDNPTVTDPFFSSI